jgi:hypothetical protein
MNINAPSLAFKLSYMALSVRDAKRYPEMLPLPESCKDENAIAGFTYDTADAALEDSRTLCEDKIQHSVFHDTYDDSIKAHPENNIIDESYDPSITELLNSVTEKLPETPEHKRLRTFCSVLQILPLFSPRS